MAAMQTIRCFGIFLKQKKIKACALIEPLPGDLSDRHYLFLAAGSAAERNTYGKADCEGSRDDRKLFGNPQGTTFDQKVREAEAILLTKRQIIESLAARVDEIVKRAGGDFNSFRVQKVTMDGVIEDFWVLLCEDELKEELKNVVPARP